MEQINLKFNNKNIRLYIRDEADQSVMREIFKFREYKSVEEIIKNAKYPILDIGAHAGFFSIYVNALNPDIKILALEPEENNLEFLAKNLDLNKTKNINIIPKALANKTGIRKLKITQDNHNHVLDQSGEKKVQAVSLKDLLNQNKLSKISLIKLDIEGGEYEIFESIKSDTLKKLENIILEYHNINNKNYKIIENKLRENKFGVQIFPSQFDKSMGFLFAKNKEK